MAYLTSLRYIVDISPKGTMKGPIFPYTNGKQEQEETFGILYLRLDLGVWEVLMCECECRSSTNIVQENNENWTTYKMMLIQNKNRHKFHCWSWLLFWR